jgi:two-component system chemotaxis response regulator CheY
LIKLRALVADDSRVMRTVVMQSLRRSGLAEFEFVEAEDGSDAVHKFSPDAFDIVFLDWNMPGMSGFEVAQQVRSLPKTEHIPIVMVTSERTMGKMEDAFGKGGANAYICKPFTADDLEQKLGKLITEIEARPKKGSGFFSKFLD